MMAIIGCVALFVVGLYIFVSGVAGLALSGSFGGKTPWQFTALAVVGACLIAIAVHELPFTFALKGGAV